MLRTILILAVIAGAVWVGMHVPHHEHPDIFQTLFLHLSPAPTQLRHGQPLSIPVPAFPSFFTLDGSGPPTGEPEIN